jgi:hypothetical protein
MKNGKYIPLGTYQDVKIGYGTVDYKNLKTIYLKLNSWLQPDNETDDFDHTILKSRRKIKEIIYNLQNPHFRQQSIVDLDIRTKGIKLEKRSFMNLEVTLYIDRQFDVKSKEVRNMVKNLMENLINDGLNSYSIFTKLKNNLDIDVFIGILIL